MLKFEKDTWALILGGSSGFGLATAKKLSSCGMNVCVVHRDRKGAMERIEEEFNTIRATGVDFVAFNTNALDPADMDAVIAALVEKGVTGKIRVMLHSIAFGNLKPIVGARPGSDEQKALHTAFHTALGVPEPEYGNNFIGDEDMAQTVYSMGTSMLTWVQKVFAAGLFAADARVLGLTSEGNTVSWRGYAAVSAAKVALEAVSRAIAVEFAPYGIRSNILQPGVTPTPALKLIPGNESMQAASKMKNPFGRLTTPADVANVVALMATDEAKWINGTIIRCDGGEAISSI